MKFITLTKQDGTFTYVNLMQVTDFYKSGEVTTVCFNYAVFENTAYIQVKESPEFIIDLINKL